MLAIANPMASDACLAGILFALDQHLGLCLGGCVKFEWRTKNRERSTQSQRRKDLQNRRLLIICNRERLLSRKPSRDNARKKYVRFVLCNAARPVVYASKFRDQNA